MHCGVAYESVNSLARDHVIRVWELDNISNVSNQSHRADQHQYCK